MTDTTYRLFGLATLVLAIANTFVGVVDAIFNVVAKTG